MNRYYYNRKDKNNKNIKKINRSINRYFYDKSPHFVPKTFGELVSGDIYYGDLQNEDFGNEW